MASLVLIFIKGIHMILDMLSSWQMNSYEYVNTEITPKGTSYSEERITLTNYILEKVSMIVICHVQINNKHVIFNKHLPFPCCLSLFTVRGTDLRKT